MPGFLIYNGGENVLEETNEPAAPGGLTGQTLTLSGASQFSARLPSGLGPEFGAYTPGALISNLIVDPNFQLRSPDTANRFVAGFFLIAGSGGSVFHVLDGVDADERVVDDGVGSTRVVEITDISQFNTIWRKVNARLNITAAAGLSTHAMRGTQAGISNTRTFNYDALNTSPVFAVPPAQSVVADVTRPLSGILYFREGAQLQVTFTAASGIYENHYHPSAVGVISIPSAASVDVNPVGVPAVGDSLIGNEILTLLAQNVNDNNPEATVALQKGSGSSTVQSTPLARGINTWASGGSDDISDVFVDELRRLIPGTAGAWNSSSSLSQGDAQVANGDLRHGADGDYPAHSSGSEAVWERRISSVSASNGTITLGGVTPAQVTQFGTGQLNVFLQLEIDDRWFDLGLDAGFSNGNGSGDSPANSLGGRFSVSGSDLNFSFGLFNTGNNSNQYRIRVVFRGANGLVLSSISGP